MNGLDERQAACDIADNHFLFADPEFVDAAIHEQIAAELQRGQALKEIRSDFCLTTEIKQSADPVEEHIAKLRYYFHSGQLSSDGVDFVLDEILAIRKETKKAAMAGS